MLRQFLRPLRSPGLALAKRSFAATSVTSLANAEEVEMLPRTQQLVQGIIAGDRTALSRAITLAESTLRRDEVQAELMLDAVLKHRRDAARRQPATRDLPTFRLGIAGPPGAGKSTFIEALGIYLTANGFRVAVLAIDPSSSRSGGSVLGDKTRMYHLSRDPNAFVRPSPSRGTLGGVAQHTNDIVLLCEAAGFDIVLVESVGLGQSEIVIDDTVDMVMLLVPPAGGDELQGHKKGIMEIADIVVINKADGELLPVARRSAVDYMHGLQLLRRKDPDWEPKVKMVSAKENKGVDKVWEVITEYRIKMNGLDKIARKRDGQSMKWMWNQLNDQLSKTVRGSEEVKKDAERMRQDLMLGFLSPRSAADQVLRMFLRTQVNNLK